MKRSGVMSGPYELASYQNKTQDFINITAVYLRQGDLVSQVEYQFVDKQYISLLLQECDDKLKKNCDIAAS